jgi:error-prone DNA polymerase
VQDARRHGIDVRPADVTASDWDCTLERGAEDTPALLTLAALPALRLGLRMIKGLASNAGERIAAARRERPFDDVNDLATRARLDRGDLNALARADALNALAGHRRNAYWHTLGVMEPIALGAAAPAESMQPELLPPSEGENIVEDYRNLALTLRRHPLALLRATLTKRRVLDAAQINAARHGQIVRVTGLVTCRQRPHTAKGVVFVTLEDETGMANIVVWSNVGDRQRKELLGAQLLTVYGHVERQGEVVHVIAGRLRDDTELLGRLEVGSRDFH